MSYLRYLYLFPYSDVQRIIVLCFCFVFLRLVYPIYVASFSGLSFFDRPFHIL